MAVHGATTADLVALPDDTRPAQIKPGGRRLRLALVAAAAVLLLSGTLFGSDDMFPFGPFHMYSNYYPPNGVITSTAVVALTASGHTVFVTQRDTGLARGDIEGELPAFKANPNRLGDLAASYHQRFPNASPFIDMRLIQKRWTLHNREVVATNVVTLVEWHAS
jgi:hypothetical protein